MTGSVAVLSPAAAASTSTVATLQSPPPTIVDSVSSREFLTIVERWYTQHDPVLNRSSCPYERARVPLLAVVGVSERWCPRRHFGAHLDRNKANSAMPMEIGFYSTQLRRLYNTRRNFNGQLSGGFNRRQLLLIIVRRRGIVFSVGFDCQSIRFLFSSCLELLKLSRLEYKSGAYLLSRHTEI